jgi:hypothetical protein
MAMSTIKPINQAFLDKIFEDLKSHGFIERTDAVAKSLKTREHEWFFIKESSKSDLRAGINFHWDPPYFSVSFNFISKSYAAVNANDWRCYGTIAETCPKGFVYCQSRKDAIKYAMANFKGSLDEQKKSVERKMKLLKGIEGAM